MYRRSRTFTAALALTLCVPSLSSAQRPGTTPAAREAKLLLGDAARLERQKQPAAALQATLAAFARDPNPLYLADIARLEEETGDLPGAYRDYERFMEETTSPPAAKAAEATRALRRLSFRVGWITIEAAAPGAAVALDGDPAGLAPVTRVVAPGAHRVALLKAGKPTGEQLVEVAAAQTTTVHLPVPPEPTVAAPPDPSPSPPPPAVVLAETPEERSNAGPWVAWSAAGALAIATGVTSAFAVDRSAVYNRAQNTFGVTRAELEASQSEARAYAVTAGVLGGATVVGIAVASLLTFVPAEGPTVPKVGLGPSGITVHGEL